MPLHTVYTNLDFIRKTVSVLTHLLHRSAHGVDPAQGLHHLSLHQGLIGQSPLDFLRAPVENLPCRDRVSPFLAGIRYLKQTDQKIRYLTGIFDLLEDLSFRLNRPNQSNARPGNPNEEGNHQNSRLHRASAPFTELLHKSVDDRPSCPYHSYLSLSRWATESECRWECWCSQSGAVPC